MSKNWKSSKQFIQKGNSESITIDGIDEKFEVTRIFEAIEKMKAVAEENLCMVMVFAIVSAMQEEIEEL
ncbi:unnamed protein product [Caenorhabditis angaria]|uniref:Uncharacterized protein n=1 Tax=Caenorhabditis angaria TaxID=860376 RepID=A0A9P1IMZ4_9PELO|nr:unnamed protein product [Caenorhabditis angaria]